MNDYDRYLAATQEPMIIGVNAMFLILTLLAVFLRFYARKITGAGFWVCAVGGSLSLCSG